MISWKRLKNRPTSKRKRSGRVGGSRWLTVESLEERLVLSTSYIATDLVSDLPGVARVTDESLHNAWGISLNPAAGAFWVSSNEEGISELYSGDVAGSAIAKVPLEVNIPGGAPTGQVFNTTTDFVVHNGLASAPSVFIFASESGSISGWNPNVPQPAPPPSTDAQLGFQASDDAIYKGIALASSGGQNFLYATDFHNGKIDVLDKDFHLVHLAGSFSDPNTPAGFAPFNIAAIGGKLYVAYAEQEAGGGDEVHGAGLGFVDVFSTDGHMLQRLTTGGKLNAPWGMVVSPSGFGDFSNSLLVGNVGDGRINAFDPVTGAFRGTLSRSPGHPIETEELWGLAFGNGVTAGDKNTLYFSAGPNEEEDGIFGKITANAAGTVDAQATLAGDVLQVFGGRDNDNILVRTGTPQQIVVQAGGKVIGTFSAASVATIEVSGFTGNDHIIVAAGVKAKTILDGGADNDTVLAGGGPSVLLGGPGNDLLIAGFKRSVLIGGDGHDSLIGGPADDILIGGSTAHDANSAALLQILDEWNSNDSFSTRKDKLTNGTGGLPKLDSTTVIDDGIADLLIGGGGHNWLFSGVHDLLIGA